MLQAQMLARRSLSRYVVIGRHDVQLPRQFPAMGPALGTSRTLAYTSSVSATKWFYAVRKGRQTGVYDHWDDAKAQVQGFPGAEHQKLASREAADAFVEGEVLLGAVSSPERLVVYTDGSHQSEGKGGFGAYFAADSTPDMYERVPAVETTGGSVEPGSNSKAELFAVLRVLEVDPDPSREIHFHSDSSYVVEAFNGRDGVPPSRHGKLKNRDMILYIQELIDHRARAVKFFWIKGHGGLPGNVDADKLADKAARLPDVPSRDIKADLEAYRAKLAKAEEEAKTKAQARNAKRSQALRQRRRRLA